MLVRFSVPARSRSATLTVVGAIGVSANASYTTNDVQEFLESLDLAALAKL